MFAFDQGQPAKRRFIVSKWERAKVNKLVLSIKNGWLKPGEKDKKPEPEKLYDLWGEEKNDALTRKHLPPFIAAPKLKLPGHAESYNPAEEYLFDEEERQAWENADPEDRITNFIPKKFNRLRHVVYNDGLVKERFERCLDLYMCPRVRKKKLNIDPESLLPKLPQPSELRPFPTIANVEYIGHQSRVRALTIDPVGQYIASGDEAGNVILWDVLTTRVIQRFQLPGIVSSLEWQRVRDQGLLAIAYEDKVLLIVPKTLPRSNREHLDEELKNAEEKYKSVDPKLIEWTFVNPDTEDFQRGYRVSLNFEFNVRSVTFHHKGDYFATVSPNTQKNNEQVYVHSLSKAASQRPFGKAKSNIQKVAFHPTKPLLFIVTQRNVYVYNLQKQALTRKLNSGAKWISCIAIHPGGDNLIIGSYDKRVIWFDLDLGDLPYKTMKFHNRAVRQVAFHNVYPLFLTSSDDGTINVFHATVFNDLTQNALIVPVKILKGHKVKDDLGVLDAVFHPLQPWAFSAGADHKIIMWT
eukprot:TRINITY_DN5201_c0_g1_i15.p1 TRINITY_DN5201_c0_g1~~TRINITY_DN5201_c0_g1_i15.p1  ORF type:complete len:523 (+),score=136.10 TRINITY_DN5201_c0_g1_i15:1394-2962(+)